MLLIHRGFILGEIIHLILDVSAVDKSGDQQYQVVDPIQPIRALRTACHGLWTNVGLTAILLVQFATDVELCTITNL